MNDPWVLAGRKARDDLDIYLDLGPDDANVAVAIVLAAVHPEYDRVCAELGDAIYELRGANAECDELSAERDALRQAIWDAYGILGFDQDGDREPRTADLAGLIVRAATEFRADYDEAGQTEEAI